MHTTTYVRPRDKVYLFRGGDGSHYRSDVHTLCPSTHEWRAVDTTGRGPEPRANHCAASLGHSLFVCGGWNGAERFNDVWALDTRTHGWTLVNGGEGPEAPLPATSASPRVARALVRTRTHTHPHAAQVSPW